TLSSSVQAARFVRTWIGTGRGENGATRVTLVWEPLPAQPGVRRDEAGGVSVLALNEQGDLVYRGRSPEDGAPAPQPAGGAASPRSLVFDAPPGRLDLRLSIDAAAGGTLDSENRSITVPDLAAGTLALSTPRVYRARTARDFRLIAAD